MDEILTAQFDRVDKALNTLVDSIAAFNPSPQAAIDLVAADEELSNVLDQLAEHQANHEHLQTLRAEIESLEGQLKSSVATLASLRHELYDTPATKFPEDLRPVPFDELLRYATNISKCTVPPTYRERAPEAEKERDGEDPGASALESAPTPAKALDTGDIATENKEGQPTMLEVTAEEEEWLRKLQDNKLAWFPWPSNDKIRSGNLFKLLIYREKGFDLSDFNIHAYEEAEKLKSLQNGEQPQQDAIEMQPAEPQVALEQQQPVAMAAAAAAPPPPQPQPRAPVATFDAFDDLEDD